ncbi:hypothetical protein AAFC00_006664 [Neodothiora populina]|uniref:Threonyl/alanyl tRNA synthetase SAD domain-containing protein n=1 Tax=Neodothiora populina TaxID=2781224 RepID=A0ABR3PBZ7_9PEZI
MSAGTKKLYMDNGALRQHMSKIVRVTPTSSLPEADRALVKDPAVDDLALVTDETIFYVQGGGQPADTGVIRPYVDDSLKSMEEDKKEEVSFRVTSVRYPSAGHEILHFGHFAPRLPHNNNNSPIPFAPPLPILQQIDSAKRDLHSRLHTAGHILGLAINTLSAEGVLPTDLVESKASHYPDSAAVEFVGLIDGVHKAAIQKRTDEFVASGAGVRIHYWSLADVMSKCSGVADGFGLPDGEERARVVEIVGLGAYPCGGTHVEDCKLVGGIEVRKIARSKGVSRVSYRVL